MLAGHRYRVSAYGEEGHTVDVEIDAVAKARPTLVETETSAKEDSSLPPALGGDRRGYWCCRSSRWPGSEMDELPKIPE